MAEAVLRSCFAIDSWVRVRALALAIILAATLALTLAGPVNAGDLGGYNFDGVNIRTGPATSYTSIGLGYTPHSLCYYFTVDGENINGNVAWWYHTNLTTGVGPGYSSSWYVFRWAPLQPC